MDRDFYHGFLSSRILGIVTLPRELGGLYWTSPGKIDVFLNEPSSWRIRTLILKRSNELGFLKGKKLPNDHRPSHTCDLCSRTFNWQCTFIYIRQATLKFLHDEFEVTNADGASREEAIRLAGIKTFFIVKVIKPVSITKDATGSWGYSLCHGTDKRWRLLNGRAYMKEKWRTEHNILNAGNYSIYLERVSTRYDPYTFCYQKQITGNYHRK